MFWNPLVKWKNLRDNPNVVVRRDVDSFSDSFNEVEKRIDFLRNFAQKRRRSEDEIVSISNTINNIRSKSTKGRSKRNEQILKDLGSLMSRQKKILQEQKKAIVDYKIYSKDTGRKIESLVHAIYSLNISVLTLLHRERVDADRLIDKVKRSKGLPGVYKEQLVRVLNQVKLECRNIAKRMYDSYQYQERSVSNPLEAFRELSPMPTRIKCKKIRHLSVEIDTYENYVQEQLKNIRAGDIPELIKKFWVPQLVDIQLMAENHIAILSHRVNRLINNIVKNELLKKKYKIVLKGIVSQASYLVNSIQVEEFRAGSAQIIKFRKEDNKKEIRKAA